MRQGARNASEVKGRQQSPRPSLGLLVRPAAFQPAPCLLFPLTTVPTAHTRDPTSHPTSALGALPAAML